LNKLSTLTHWTSPWVKSLINSTGFPAQYYSAGINLPGGTTEFGPIIAPLSIFAPSKIIDLNPTITLSSIVHEYKVQLFYMLTWEPILTEAGIPVGNYAAVWITVLSPIEVLFPILTAFKSPLITAPYQT